METSEVGDKKGVTRAEISGCICCCYLATGVADNGVKLHISRAQDVDQDDLNCCAKRLRDGCFSNARHRGIGKQLSLKRPTRPVTIWKFRKIAFQLLESLSRKNCLSD